MLVAGDVGRFARVTNENFWGLLPFHYILSTCYDMDRAENTASNSSFISVCVFVAAGTRLPSRCPAMLLRRWAHRQQSDVISLHLFCHLNHTLWKEATLAWSEILSRTCFEGARKTPAETRTDYLPNRRSEAKFFMKYLERDAWGPCHESYWHTKWERRTLAHQKSSNWEKWYKKSDSSRKTEMVFCFESLYEAVSI
jgi:hypothetical protein